MRLATSRRFGDMFTRSCFLEVFDDVDGLGQDMAVLDKRRNSSKGLDLFVFLSFL